jgi:hypothetical protein
VGKRHVEAQGGNGGVVEEDFEALVTALPARLGRTGGGAPPGEEPGCFVALGNIKSLSRHHATIEWDFDKGCYRISCLSEWWRLHGHMGRAVPATWGLGQ